MDLSLAIHSIGIASTPFAAAKNAPTRAARLALHPARVRECKRSAHQGGILTAGAYTVADGVDVCVVVLVSKNAESGYGGTGGHVSSNYFLRRRVRIRCEPSAECVDGVDEGHWFSRRRSRGEKRVKVGSLSVKCFARREGTLNDSR